MKLKRGHIQIKDTAVDSVFLKYLRGEERSLTINELDTYIEVHLKNRKGWQRKLDKGVREIDLRCASICFTYHHVMMQRLTPLDRQ